MSDGERGAESLWFGVMQEALEEAKAARGRAAAAETRAVAVEQEVERLRQERDAALNERGNICLARDLDACAKEKAAAESRAARYRKALRKCLSAMEMQERRETGEFHIPGETALCIWRDAQAAARALLPSDEEDK